MKQKAITVSVVIPAYNEEKNIERTLSSILLLRPVPSEIVVINNNSSDKTGDLARKMGVRVIEENVRGISTARNAGFNAAKGDLLIRCDADTVVPQDWIQTVVDSFKDVSVVAVTGPADYFDDTLPDWVSRSFGFFQNVFYFQLSRLLLGHHVLLGLNCAIRRDGWKKISSSVCTNDKIMHEDMDLAIHINPYGKIAYVPRLRVKTSLRRLHRPFSLFVVYPTKWVITIIKHFFPHKK
ncbi:MAG: glycosyltransferase [Candidatus Roizmanbacteria bacterium]|nr:glycosyltransferase [Candidatus Roizmanbacteria bacterium]